ncbi:hypothetical protein [Pseudoteredinibacter isoporae]|uniref:DUF370 domain-containing protein n=1 Tax=Pseudoteredinibacter isoporae TaxID=570281 RepID=A0A7X0JX15_9GAMM|nr:hypothetical protein [Pseudoteredinibacter isoporae]MBB6523827.1 hypothetical protein [Pseudoteredinibacter isoporae]NHO89347.1 hypothetical protein [Pseudoteredinibacter isoporae]NIB22454.1 hypothetical protein [Pseudoteredinibacter isoporae]
MKYIEVNVKTALIVHGFDEDNQEIIEKVNDENYMKKLVSIERIQSISNQYLLVSSSHGRIIYWEYEEDYAEIKAKLESQGMIV